MRHNSTETAVTRVLHVITPSRMAGAETFLARLLRRTKQLPVAAAHCVTSRSEASRELRAAGVEIEPLGIGGKANLFAMPRLAAAARRFNADLLHSHLSTASWWSGWLEFFGGPPSIGHVHGFTSARWHHRQSHLIACSSAVKADLIEKGFRPERITVMRYPVDPDDQRARRAPADVRAEFGVLPQTPVVGTFAHLSPKKGYRELVQAARIVLRQLPDAQFWCFGDGILRAELEQFAASAGIAGRFRLLGFRRDVPDLMRAVDVMCLPSHREPFGLVYVEAGLAEKPVIACAAGGAPEIVEHGVNGLLVPSPVGRNNIEPLAGAILSLLENRGASAAMGRRGREMALDRFGWTAYMAQLEALYARVLGRDAPAHSPSVRQAA
jgi:glycosyltransferase involved in cell wall biosynthesis